MSIVGGAENWIFGGKDQQGITPRWSFICKDRLQLTGRQEILRLNISNIKTQLLSGYANLYVHYENIPGYWDGYITVPIHKGPLVYRETTANDIQMGCVGIGTDEPQAKLHVKSSSGVDGLKVEGNTAIQGKLTLGADIYFTKTDHTHTGLLGNTEGYAAIENAQNHSALMILGRSGPNGKIVKLWDELQVNGKMQVKSSSGVDGKL